MCGRFVGSRDLAVLYAHIPIDHQESALPDDPGERVL